MSKILLSLILVSAGVLHLTAPYLFNAAIPFESKGFINLFSGVLEIILAIGLLTKKFQDLAARISAFWFLILTPIHIYVSWNHIMIFGTNNPLILWFRTALQPGLFFWALSLQTKGWIMAQEWKDILFLHYSVNADQLQKQVPFKLDLYQGEAIVSIVSFTMDKIRFPFLPPIPGLSKLNELNLRTYVEVDGVKGVYFFTLDTDLLPAILIARKFFSLPYHLSKLFLKLNQDDYYFESINKKTSLKFNAKLGATKQSDAFDLWATERYGLFTKKSNKTLHGIVEHIPWQLQETSIIEIDDHFSSLLGEKLKAKDFSACSYSKKLNVRFRPFYQLKTPGVHQ